MKASLIQRRGKNGRQHLSQIELFSNYQCTYREGGHSHLMLYATRVGIPILLPGSLLRRRNHGA